MYNKHFLPGKTISKHNDLIRTSMQNIDTNLGYKVLACLISKIQPEDTELTFAYAVEVKNFLKTGDGRDYKNISQLAESLVDSKIELKIGKKRTFFPIFRQIQYDDGLILGVFNDLLKPYLLNLQTTFTEINLIEYLTLSSVYSQRLFEILKSWKNIKRGFVEIAITDLHAQLNVAVSQKNNFKEFRTKVLERAHKEIVSKTNFNFEWEPIKQGTGKTSPVIAIRFIFSKKQALPIAEKKKDIERQNKIEKSNLNISAEEVVQTPMMNEVRHCITNYPDMCNGHNDKNISDMCKKMRKFIGKK